MQFKYIQYALLKILFLCLPLSSLAATWQLDSAQSSIGFFTIKKGTIGEWHVFTDFNGSIKEGNAVIVVKPDSIDSKVGIRDERMREFLFETGIYPTIKITADVKSLLASTKKGKVRLLELPASLSLHGVTKKITLKASLSKTRKGILFSSVEPVVVRAADFNMKKGVVKLSELVGGIPIASTVPVTYTLLFKK